MDLSRAADVMAEQDGVVARRQLVSLGATPHDLERWLRRRELTIVHPGVYIDHTGNLTWPQRAWAAVLACGDRAALWACSALRAHDSGVHLDSDGSIHVAVPASRHPVAPVGVVVVRRRGLDAHVQWSKRPPRQRYDDAVIEVAAAQPRPLDGVGVLAAAVNSRRTTARRLLANCHGRSRLNGREWLEGVLGDLASGTHSVLEHGYLTLVERPHGLPSGRRQVPETIGGVVYRDVEYEGLVIELDGAFHQGSSAQRDADLERDLDVAVSGRDTVRLGWGQVFERSCSTAAKIARLLTTRGWPGRPRGCSPGCPIA